MSKPMKKVIKAWASWSKKVDDVQGVRPYLLDIMSEEQMMKENSACPAIFEKKKWATYYARKFNGRVIPCTISYSLPSTSKTKRK